MNENENENKEKTPVIQQNATEVEDAPDLSEQYAAHDKLRKIWEDGMNEYTPKSKEELEKERKKLQRDKIIGAVGDGISAIANLVGTANYAPNMYNGASSLSAKAQERYDKAMQDYKDRRAQYMNYAMNWGKEVQAEGEMKYKAWKDKAANKIAQSKADSQIAVNGERQRKEAALANTAEIGANNAQRDSDDKHELSVSRKNAANASAAASAASANLSSVRATGETGKIINFMGKGYKTNQEYEKAVYDAYKTWNKAHPKDMISDRGLLNGKQVKRPLADIAAEVERKQTEVDDEMKSYKRE